MIRFALSDLGTRNGHHVFEEICRYFAQQRIASNILPATGPVSGGGDQGRDLETFHSYLLEELGPHGAFLGLASEGHLVFTATTQQEDVDKKILADVQTILRSGRVPIAIYAFHTGDLKVAKRHKLEKYIAKQFEGQFEVIGRDAIAAQLANPDLFWVAEQFLTLPAGLAPLRPADEPPLPEWYLSDRDRWRERGSAYATLGDIIDLKDGLRHATRFADARPDLPFWLSLARPLADDEAPEDVRHRARYEIAWATFQTQGDLRAVDDLVEGVLSDVVTHDEIDPAVVEDAGVLLSVATTALQAGRTRLTAMQIREWNDVLRERVREALNADPRPTRKAQLLDLLGELSLSRDPLAVNVPDAPHELPDVLSMVDDNGEMKPVVLERGVLPVPIDVAETMAAWGELSKLFATTPLFPVERFSRRITFYAPLLVDEKGWRDLVDAMDGAAKRASGSAAVAAAAHGRGVALSQVGRIRDALHEIHTAKVEWWGGDTLRGSLLAMLFVSRCYEELRLPQAAKQYALAASYAALASHDDDVVYLISVGLLAASELDYSSGAWCGALELVDLGLLAQANYVDVGSSSLAQNQLDRAAFTVGFCLRITRQLATRFVPFVERIAKKFDMYEGLDEVDRSLPVDDRTQLLARIDEQLLGRALCDSGRERVIRFAALGTDWTITASNRFAEARAAERFSAAVQIALVELSEDELCLVPSSIRVRVELAPEGVERDDRIQWAPSNEGRNWRVRLTPIDLADPLDSTAISVEVMTMFSTILIDASLLPADRYLAAIDDAFRRGLSHKLASVRPYDELGVPQRLYDHTPRAVVHPPSDPKGYPAREHEQLAWRTTAGPTYDREEALSDIRERYRRTPELVPRTLARLAADEGFAQLVRELRNRGWLDWHLLQALVNAALNDKLRREDLATYGRREEINARTQELIDQGNLDEDPDDPIQPSVEDLDFHRRGAIPVMLRAFGLELNQETPDFEAIDRFLGARYGYWTDDVEHVDPFPLASNV